MSEHQSSSNWGGKRKGAGRKREKDTLAVKRTKVARLSIKDWSRIKSGAYDELMDVLVKYRNQLETSKGCKTSPRWQKMREMFAEVDEIFGCDYRTWNLDRD